MKEVAHEINKQWIGNKNSNQSKPIKVLELMLTNRIWLRQFQDSFLYGCDLQILHKGKPKYMVIYLDNNRDNLLWISSKTKAFILDLYFTSVVYQQIEQLQEIRPRKFYFTLKQFSEEVVLIFDKQEQKNQKSKHFNLYIEDLKKKNPKYCAYFSSISKKYALQTTKKGSNSTFTQKDILKFSQKIGLKQESENKKMLDHCLKHHKVQNRDNITFQCIDQYFKIQFCSRALYPIFSKYLGKQLQGSENPRCVLEKIMDLSNFKRFLLECQKQTDPQKIKLIIQSFDSPLSFFDFCLFVYDEKYCAISQAEVLDESHPLNHYFCYSSHNTYLSGNQLTSDSKVSRYNEDLQNGIKCVELDVHDNGDIPIITHAVKGQGLCKQILFEDVIKEIDRFSQQSLLEGHSHYPIILSIENHASQENKDKMLNILTKYLNESLYMVDENSTEFPPLSYLKGKIIIKTSSKQSQLRNLKNNQNKRGYSYDAKQSLETSMSNLAAINIFKNEHLQRNYGEFSSIKKKWKIKKHKFNSRIGKIEQLLLPVSSMAKITSIFKAQQGIKTLNSSPFQCTSLTNAKVMKTDKNQIIQYSKRSWLRTYPTGTEIGSDNYDPIPMLEVGAQIVALNTQTKNSDAWITHGYFCSGRFNPPGMRGYVLKPERLLPSYKGDSVLSSKPKVCVTIELLQKNGYDVKIKFRGVQKDMDANKSSLNEFIVSEMDEGFIIFNIGQSYRDCCALRFLSQGYRVIQVKNKQNYSDTGGRIIVMVKKRIV